MRLILLLLTVVSLGATAWFATSQGTDSSGVLGAPQIERLVARNVSAAIADIDGSEVEVTADGRRAILTGQVENEETRDALVAAASGGRLVAEVTDRLGVIETVRPFPFLAERLPNGGLVLKGHVPNANAETRVLAVARQVAEGEVRSELSIAGGAPDGDWAGAATAGITALGKMRGGTLRMTDFDAVLTGDVDGPAGAEEITAALSAAPWVTWDRQLGGVLPMADPYVFTALTTPDGAILLGGNAPDAPTRDALVEAAGALSDQPVDGALTLADGMPSPDWPDKVRQGLAALGLAQSGLLKIEGPIVEFTVEAATQSDREALLGIVGNDWLVTITVPRAAPEQTLHIILAEDGSLTASGHLPAPMTTQDLAAALPGVVPDALLAGSSDQDYSPALEALSLVLPRLQSGAAQISGGKLVITGTLRRGFTAEGSDAAIRPIMPDSWGVVLTLAEAAPLAEAMFSSSGDEIVLTGLLPQGLEPGRALDVLGEQASGEGLATGGDGDAGQWHATLDGLSGGLMLFSRVTGRIAQGTVSVDGTLRPGYDPNLVQDWLSARMAPGWKIGVTAEQSTPSEGDERLDLATNERETFRSGFWLPDVDFQVSVDRCDSEAKKAVAQQTIQFVPGSARIDQAGRKVLDRLAAIAIRCLNSSTLKLSIQGHTDAQGNDESNQALSVARAEAVLAALTERGVRTGAMVAVGFGETQPIATNDTPDGRAENRRIEFGFAVGSE